MDILEDVHNARYTYNDLKPDNIMLSSDLEGNIKVSLIDYGFAKKYKEHSKHIEKNTESLAFQGNLLFASPNQLNFYATSRIDDLQSLLYLMFYMFNGCYLPGFDRYDEETTDKIRFYKNMTAYKKDYSPQRMLDGTEIDSGLK